MTEVLADPGLDPGADPLSAAIAQRDRDTLKMVDIAVRAGNVMLAYQPIMQARTPGRLAFFEGLIRVQDQTGRTIPARDFIDVVETHEVGRILDCLALQRGIDALARHPDLRLSINMSARSIGYRRWTETLERGIATNPSIAGRLILEITEASAMVMPDIVQVFMAELHAKGITFALDDFGAGFTSFRYLKRFEFDILKIDGQFIRDVHSDSDNQVLMHALISIAQQFEMFTVAEAVETAREARFLTALGIDCLQGHYLGAPKLKPDWKLTSAP
ncbi:MAG: EAL domain-containing protein [Pseudomonadota bacterium]